MYIFVFEVYYLVPSLFCKNVDEYDHYNIQWYELLQTEHNVIFYDMPTVYCTLQIVSSIRDMFHPINIFVSLNIIMVIFINILAKKGRY
jgi:hypothetical protein